LNSELLDLVGDLSRFESNESQVRSLVDVQQSLWHSTLGSWVVVPLDGFPGFSILARDVEGQRQAREIFTAFIGPTLATVANDPRAISLDGNECRLVPILVRHGKHVSFLDVLEGMTATRLSIDREPSFVTDDESDLLRDMRLAISQQDFGTAQSAYDRLRSLGTISQENMRFLNIELLAGQNRWGALVGLPYFDELQNSRRPRTVSEFMLEAIWQTSVVSTGRPPAMVFAESDLQTRYGPLLGSVDVPRSRGALALAYLSSRQDGNQARVERQLSAVTDDDRTFLDGLSWQNPTVIEKFVQPIGQAQRLYERQQYSDVAELFLASPEADAIHLAVNSVLELDDASLAAPVLAEVRRLAAEGAQIPRALSLLLPHLEVLVSKACSDWIQWMTRVAAAQRWAVAASTARENSRDWPALPVSEDLVNLLADDLLNAIDGVNADQVRATLDLLCVLASDAVSEPSQRKFVEAVLLCLAVQDNAGEPVRNAFSNLVWTVLESAPDEASYRSLLATVSDMWSRIASLTSIDWALGLLEGFVVHSCPVPEDRRNFALNIVSSIAKYAQRFEPSQILSLRALLEEIGEQPWPDLAEEQTEEDPWSKLDSADLGIHTLFESEIPKLRQRLDQLTHLKSFTHNKDHGGTTALRNLSASAQYLIVDTWHAKHAATEEIDKYRPRSRQIIPRRGGALAWLQALKEHIAHAQSE
jgi:hypothetical protein